MKKYIVLFTILFVLSLTNLVYAQEVMLDKDTQLHPMGWVTGSLTFKGGTKVVLNNRYEVVSGTLYYSERLETIARFQRNTDFALDPEGGLEILCKSGTPVSFNETGKVIACTLSAETSFFLPSGGIISADKGTEVVFYKNGQIAKCTITKGNAYFRPAGWTNFPLNYSAGFILFKNNKQICFNEQGEVTEGIVAESIKLPNSNGQFIEYKSGDKVHFNEKGEVI